jgi:hypothetical protein
VRIQYPSLAAEDANKGGQPTGDKAAADAAGKPAADAAAKAIADAAAGAGAKDGQAVKDADAKAAADAAAAKGNEPPPAKTAPAKYELKIPEHSTLNDSDVKAIETIARENGWTNDEAQLALQHHHDTLIEQSEQFLAETKADKTYGGDNLAKSQARAKSVIDLIRPANHPRRAAFTALLDRSGYGNQIEILSFLADLGAKLDEDGGGMGDGTGGGRVEGAADKLYGSTK